MGTEIKTWQIVERELRPIETNLQEQGRTEPYDLEPWIASHPDILSPDILIIGRQVRSKSGPIDLLGIDRSGNLVIIELKRNQLPREALAQAIDYASDVAEWTVDRISEECMTYCAKTLEECFGEFFQDAELESVSVNGTQRILLVGFAVESSLERMIQWLSDVYSVNINAVVLSYLRTSSGDEVLAKTTIISEELEQERVRKKKFTIKMSDKPGEHDPARLRELLIDYLGHDRVTNQRIRDVLLPSCLKKAMVTREELKRSGVHPMSMSTQIGLEKNSFLRQVLSYGYPRNPWEKDNFAVREEYKGLVRGVLDELGVKTG